MSKDLSRRRRRKLLWVARILLRKGAEHALGVCHLVLNFGLAFVAGVLAYVVIRSALPVPEFMRERIERELAQAGFEARFDGVEFGTAGGVTVRGFRLVPARFGEPVLTAAELRVQLDPLKLTAGMVEVERIDAADVRVLCPTSISPTGAPETLVSIAGATLWHDHGDWTVDGLLARIGPVYVTAHGILRAPLARPDRPAGQAAPLDPIRRFGELAPRLARLMAALQTLEEPSVRLAFDGRLGDEIAVEAEASLARWRDARFGELHGLRFSTQLKLGAAEPAPVVVAGRVDSLTREGIAARGVAFTAEWPALPAPARPWPARVELAAQEIRHPKVVLDSPLVTLEPSAFPQVRAQASFSLAGEIVALDAEADASTRAGRVRALGRFGRDWLARASAILGRDVTYYAAIEQPPDFAATAEFGEGAKWRLVELSALSGPIVARGVPLDRARVHGTVTPGKVRLDRLEFSHGDEAATGVYEDTLATRENRFLLRGRMRPRSISRWFGPWWDRFWRDYTLSGPAPRFDVDVRGNWLAGEKNVVRGSAHAERVAIKGVPVDTLEGNFFIRPNYYDLFNASIGRPEGRVDGEVQLLFKPGQRDPRVQTFRFVSTADLVDLARIFGSGGEKLLAPYRYDTPPRVTVTGSVENDAGAYDTRLDIGIETATAFRYFEFPLESVGTEVHIHNRLVELPHIRATYAGGAVRATATADHGTLSFDASLQDADYDAAVETFRTWLNRDEPPPPAEARDAGFANRRTGGRLAITFAAKGPVTDFRSYEGTGTARITEANLGRVNLIGLLSELFSSVGIKLGVLNFHEASSNFRVDRDRIHFDEGRITGRTAILQLAGTYLLTDSTMDFRARLFPLRESDGAITQLFGMVLDPFSNLFEIRLIGTLRQPKWMFTRGPTAILRALAGPAQPPAPGQAPGTAPSPEGSGVQPGQTSPPPGNPAVEGAPEDPPASPPPPDNPGDGELPPPAPEAPPAGPPDQG